MCLQYLGNNNLHKQQKNTCTLPCSQFSFHSTWTLHHFDHITGPSQVKGGCEHTCIYR